MIKEEYVQYETAMLLKEAGFPQDKRCCLFYNKYGQDWHFADGYIGNGYAKPSQAQAMRWLREEFGIFIEMTFNEARNHYPYYADLQSNQTGEFLDIDYQRAHSTYEAAAEAGIQAACKYLIDKNKKQ